MALPYLGIVFLVTTGAPTWSCLFYVAAIGVMLVGLWTIPERRPERERIGSRFGARRPPTAPDGASARPHARRGGCDCRDRSRSNLHREGRHAASPDRGRPG